jgi:hypothetical protein
MNHFATPSFWTAYDALPATVQAIADKSFELLKTNSRHPSLHFKKIGNLWSVRANYNYRALATEVDGDTVWFWIGNHSQYDRLIA